jgi:hypothetical protein
MIFWQGVGRLVVVDVSTALPAAAHPTVSSQPAVILCRGSHAVTRYSMPRLQHACAARN